MRKPDVVVSGLLPGAVGGLAGGVVFGAAMHDLGVLSSVASIVRLESQVVGFLINMAIAATVGAGLGLLVWHQRLGLGETLFWGLVYGTFWWFIGTLSLHPLFLGDGFTWDAESARTGFPALIGHMLYGSTAALVIVVVRRGDLAKSAATRVTLGEMWTGAAAGVLAAWMVGAILAAQGELPSFVAMADSDSRPVIWLQALGIGGLFGLTFAILYPRPTESAGAGLIRGAMYGLFWWVAVPLSVLPALDGGGLPWSAREVAGAFPSMPGYVLFGAAAATFYQWLGGAFRVLFSDTVAGSDEEGIGARGLRTMGHGVLAGIVGGLVFTGVMVQTGALSTVASLIGESSSVTGFFVHLAIAILVGASYGLLFRGQSYDAGSALGWGASYGFIWWIIGPLTLMPAFLGTTPQWTATAAAQVFPNLIGHLGYGAGLGVTLYLLEARYSPWWVPRTEADAALVERRKEQVRTSAPAIWTLVVVISLTLPILLGAAGEAGEAPFSY